MCNNNWTHSLHQYIHAYRVNNIILNFLLKEPKSKLLHVSLHWCIQVSNGAKRENIWRLATSVQQRTLCCWQEIKWNDDETEIDSLVCKLGRWGSRPRLLTRSQYLPDVVLDIICKCISQPKSPSSAVPHGFSGTKRAKPVPHRSPTPRPQEPQV